MFDRVLIEKSLPIRQTVGGIMLPETVVKGLNEGKVIAVGQGRRIGDGKFAPLSVNVGDLVMLSEYGGNEVKLNGKDYMLVREDEILGIVEESPASQSSIPNAKDIPSL